MAMSCSNQSGTNGRYNDGVYMFKQMCMSVRGCYSPPEQTQSALSLKRYSAQQDAPGTPPTAQ
jgi:hypothetical protein